MTRLTTRYHRHRGQRLRVHPAVARVWGARNDRRQVPQFSGRSEIVQQWVHIYIDDPDQIGSMDVLGKLEMLHIKGLHFNSVKTRSWHNEEFVPLTENP